MEKPRTFYNSSLFRWILRAGITVVFVVMVDRGVTFAQIKELAAGLQISWLCLALCLAALSLLFQILRWQAVLKVLGFAGRPRESIATFLWGNLLGFVTPGRVGEFGRGLGLDPARKGDSVAAVVIDKCFSTAFTALFGLAGMAVQTLALGIRPPRFLTIFIAGFFIAVPPVLLLLKIALDRPGFLKGKQSPFFRVVANIAAVRHHLFNWRTVGYSAIAHVLLLLQTMAILRMLGCGPSGTNFMIAAEAYAFMLFLPFFIANIGLREYSFGMMLRNLTPVLAAKAALPSVALGIATLVLVMNVLLPAVAGLCVMIVDKKHKATL